MFGGLAFLIGGNMAVAAGGKGAMMVRARADRADDLLDEPGATIVVMQNRPMTGWIEVDAEHLATLDQLRFWVDVGVEFARTLPGIKTPTTYSPRLQGTTASTSGSRSESPRWNASTASTDRSRPPEP